MAKLSSKGWSYGPNLPKDITKIPCFFGTRKLGSGLDEEKKNRLKVFFRFVNIGYL
jgi:hypothetical protein